MNWDAIGAIGELLGAAVVFISLIYLGTQIRHSSKSMRSQNLNAQTDQILAVQHLQVEPSLQQPLINCYIKNLEELEAYDAGAVESYLFSMLYVARNQYLHEKAGLDSEWSIISKRIPGYFSAQWPKKWWGQWGRKMFEADFAEEIDRIISISNKDAEYWVDYEKNRTGASDG